MIRGTRWTTAIVWAATVVVAAGAGVLAGRATFSPPAAGAVEVPAATYTVAEGTVGLSTTFTADASWPVEEVAGAAATGTVTTVDITPGETVDQGAVLYTVGLRPVVAAQGTVPSFRDLAEGSTGADVAQLQQLLIDRRHLTGRADGTFSPRTTRAVRAWQRALGVEQTGVVLAGDIVFVPDLPARLTLTEDVTVGAVLEPGAPTVRTLRETPEVTLSVDGNATAPTRGTAVVVTLDAMTWPAVVAGLRAPEEGTAGTTVVLSAPDGGPVCGDACDQVPIDLPPGALVAQVETVPTATGPVVPVAALGTAADGSVFVLDASGTRRPVQVVVTDGSRVVVSGLAAGDVIRLFGDDDEDGAGDGAPTEPSGPADGADPAGPAGSSAPS